MFVPPEQIVVLIFLLVVHFEDVVIDLSEDEEVCEGEVVAYEKGPCLEVFLEVLHRGKLTFLSYLPSLR